MAREKEQVKIPQEKVGNASGFTEINTTLPLGDKGSVEELDKALKKNPDIKK